MLSPFSPHAQATIGALGEVELIRHIARWLGPATPPPPAGIGDDAAVLPFPQGKKIVISNDSVVLGRHFTAATSPALAGRKLLARNLSDLAAMGATPHSAVIQLLCGANLTTSWLKGFYQGISSLSLDYQVPIVGGDCSQTANDSFSASLTAIGFTDRPLTRHGARPGDHILVTGSLGGSLLGKHLSFEPRLQQGIWLAARSDITAAMDLTDGIAKDLPELVPAGACARIDTAQIPLSEDALDFARRSGHPPLHHAFNDGEDYELLFTVKGDRPLDTFFAAWQKEFSLQLSHIGTLEPAGASGAVVIDHAGTPLANGGYRHFQSQ